jgi:hypothetical protein
MMRKVLGAPSGVAGAQVASDPIPSGAPDESGELQLRETVDELSLERLELIKIGPGGDGAAVLAGAAQTLWRLRPMLFIEAPDSAAIAGLAAQAEEFGYRCWLMETLLFNSGNFNCRELGEFAGATALALLAIPEEMSITAALDGCVELGKGYDNDLLRHSESTQEVAHDSGANADRRKPGVLGKLRKLFG